MIDTNAAMQGAAKAEDDVRAVTVEIAAVNQRAADLMARAEHARATNDAKLAVETLREADTVTRDMVLVRAKYQKAVEIASLVRAVAQLKVNADSKRSNGDHSGAEIDEAAAQVAAQALAKLSSTPIAIKLPEPSAEKVLRIPTGQLAGLGAGEWWDIGAHLNNIGKTIGDVANATGAKLNQFGNWVTENGPVVGGAVGAVVGSIVPGAGTAIGASIGTALGAVLQATKPQVVKNVPPPPAPAPPAPKPTPQAPAPKPSPPLKDPTQQVAANTPSFSAAGLLSNPTVLIATGVAGAVIIGAVALKNR